MKVTTLDEKSIHDIGHAFGYYDYGEETGMSAVFSGKEATANYICAYVRGVLRGGFLHTTSERGEGCIAYKLPKEKMGPKTMWPIACGMLHNSTLKRLLRFGIAIKRGGASLQDRMDKEKKPYIFVGLVCVREQYQGQGYMRKIIHESTGAAETYLAHQLPDQYNAIATPVGLLVLLLAFDWRLGLLSLAPVVLAFLIMATMTGKRMAEKMRQYGNALESMSNEAVEYVRGIPVVKTFGQSVFSFKKFKATICPAASSSALPLPAPC